MPKESVYFTLGHIEGKRGGAQLKRELDSFPGVISVSVDAEKGSLAVDFDNTGVQTEQIVRRLEKLGYEIESQKNEEHLM